MSAGRLRLRVFAGPNGSGKSTFTETFAYSRGVYINADRVEKGLRSADGLDLGVFGLSMTTAEARAAIRASDFAQAKNATCLADRIRVTGDQYLRVDRGRLADFVGFFRALWKGPCEGDERYLAAIVAEVLRDALIEAPARFSFETVMSHPDKVDLMRRARAAGFKVYLYYFCTVSPEINVTRVAERVAGGGHPVDEAKIRSRYTGSLANLTEAVRNSDRTYLYDNSGTSTRQIAEVRDGREYIAVPGESIPWWVEQYVRAPLREGN